MLYFLLTAKFNTTHNFAVSCDDMSRPISFNICGTEIYSRNTCTKNYTELVDSADVDLQIALQNVSEQLGKQLLLVEHEFFENLLCALFIAYPDLREVCNLRIVFCGTQYESKLQQVIRKHSWYGYGSVSSNLALNDVISWIYRFEDSSKTRNILILFSNALRRHGYERILSACSALEQIYVPEQRHIKRRLSERIPAIIPSAKCDLIIKAYTYRSNYAHGNTPVSIFPRQIDDGELVERYASFTLDLLVQTLHFLVEQNLERLSFET